MVNTIFYYIIHDYFVKFALNDPILLDDVKIHLVYYTIELNLHPCPFINLLVIKITFKFLQFVNSLFSCNLYDLLSS